MSVFGRSIGGDFCFQAAPATCLDQTKNGNEESASPDQNKLQNFVEDGRTQSTQCDIDGDGAGGDPDAEVDIPAENNLQHQRHGVHVDATHQHGHERKADGRECAASFSETQFQVAGNGMGFGNVVERHHHQCQEEHGGYGANPVPVRGQDSVLIRRAGPAH
jgi:hypothetical protein